MSEMRNPSFPVRELITALLMLAVFGMAAIHLLDQKGR